MEQHPFTGQDLIIQELFTAALAPSTPRVYKSGSNRYFPLPKQKQPGYKKI